MKIAINQGFILHISVMFNGVNTMSVEIKENVTGILGENGTQIKCSYTMENVITINSVSFLAINYNTTTFVTIATYLPDKRSVITSEGQYLKGRVTLIDITQSSTQAVMIFNKLLCIDDTFYQCLLRFVSSDGEGKMATSNNITISVQVPPSKPDSISLVHMPADSPMTTTKHMNYSSSSLAITSRKHGTVTALQSVTTNKTTAFNYFILTKTAYDTTSSIPSNDISYRTTTYSTQQTTTAQRIVEGDNITVVCRGYVGKPPATHDFKKYLNGKMVPKQGTVTTTSTSEMPENCSYYRTSNFTFQVTAQDNKAVIRCVVNSSMEEPDMYVETEPIEVYSDKSTPSTSGSGDNEEKDIGTLIAIVIVVILFGIGVVIVLLYRRKRKKEDNKSGEKTGSNMNPVESQKTTLGAQPTNSTQKTTGYGDVDLDDTDMNFKPTSNEETIAQLKQHNEEYLKKQKEDEDKEKDNPIIRKDKHDQRKKTLQHLTIAESKL